MASRNQLKPPQHAQPPVAVQAVLLTVAGLLLAWLLYLSLRAQAMPDGQAVPGLLVRDATLLWQGLGSLLYLLRPYLYYAHLASLLVLVLIVAGAFCLGRMLLGALCRWLPGHEDGTPPHVGLERIVMEVALGCWLQSLAMFLFFSLHWGREMLIVAVVVLLAGPILFGERYLAQAARELREWWLRQRRERRWGRVTYAQGALTLATAATLALSGIMALAPPHQSDAMRYHLTVPDIWLQAGGFTYLPNVAFSHFPFMLEMQFAIPLALHHACHDTLGLSLDNVTRLIHWLWFLLLCGALGMAARRLAGEPAGRIAAALTATTPFVPVLASWAFVEVALATTVVLAFIALVDWTRAENRERELWQLVMMGLFGGMGLSMKYTAFAVVGWLALWVALDNMRRAPVERLRGALLVGALATAMALPWFIKSYAYTGNPVYPMANEIFQGPDWTPREASLFVGHAHLKGDLWRWPQLTLAERAWDLATLPLRVTAMPSHFGSWPVGLGWLSLAPLALLALWRGRAGWASVCGVLALYLFWALTYRDSRFLLPCLALLAFTLALSLASLYRRPGPWGGLCTGMALVVVATNLITLGATVLPNAERNSTNVLPVVSGAVTVDAFLSRPDVADYYPGFQALEAMREEIEGRVLIVGQELAYRCPVPFVYSDFFNTPILVRVCRSAESVEDVRNRLAAMNVTHLLVHHGKLEHGSGYRRLYDLHFLPDDEALPRHVYTAYASGDPRTARRNTEHHVGITNQIMQSDARILHDGFLANPALLEERWRQGGVAIHRLR